jgi:hypothetical protein
MNWQNRLEKTVIALNLIGLALGFGTLGIFILVKGEQRGESWISGVLGIVVGSLFLLFAFYFCKHTWGVGSGRPTFVRQRITSCRSTGPRQLTGTDGTVSVRRR